MVQLPAGTRRAFRLAVNRPPIEAEVDDEVAFHLEMRAAELLARGWSAEAARAEALRRFGDRQQWSMAMTAVDRERAAMEHRAEWLDDLRQDLRYGVRSLLRAPLFSLLAILTLALGIGANAAVFGVVKSVLLDALPYADADRVVRIYGRRVDGSNDRGPVSVGTITDVAARQRSFTQVAAFESRPREAVYSGDGNPIVTQVAWAQPALFPTLGVSAALGRVFREEDAATDTAFNIIVTHPAWQRLFGGDPGLVGRSVRLNGIARTVIGVLPRGFVGPTPGSVDFYFALGFQGATRDPVRMRRQQNYGLVARLKPGITVDAARQDVAAIGKQLASEYPEYNGSVAIAAAPVRESMVGETRAPLLVLLASAGLVLMITCANLAGALLSRALSRRREFAVRVALGANRGRVVRQLLTESVVLALAGGASGILLAALGLGVLRGLALRALPPYADLSLDGGAVLVTTLIALGSGLAFGVMPALAVSRTDPQDTLRDEGRGTSESTRSRRLRGILVAGQIALCLSLLAGAGLLARSLWAMTAIPLGFNPDDVLTVAVQLPPGTYTTNASRSQFVSQFEDRVRTLPGVIAVASTGEVPTRVGAHNSIFPDGAAPPSDAIPIALYTTVSDDYFRTLGIPLREGRAFGPQDLPDGPPTLIINESLARRFWPNETAVGKRVRLDQRPETLVVTIVGVVGNERNDPARPDPEITMYMSNRTNPWNGPIFVIRAKGDPLALVRPVQQTLASMDPRLPLHNPITLRALLSEGLAGRRLPVVLMAAFGALALLLASVGVYAMFAAMAAAREREFGVRMALGSSRGAIARLVLRQGGVWMVVGLVVGAGGVVVVARLMRGLLYGVAPFDPVALGVAVVLLLASAMVALLVPVRRATRIDPITALRG